MIEIMIERLKKIKNVRYVILATTQSKSDNILIKIAKKCKIKFYRGETRNVMKRVLKCAKSFFESKVASRVTLPDPKVIENDPSTTILASKVSPNHRPSTSEVLLLAQSWSRGVSAPSFGGPERPPGSPKTSTFLTEPPAFPLCAPHRFWTAQGPQVQPTFNPLCTSAPCPCALNPTLLNQTFP